MTDQNHIPVDDGGESEERVPEVQAQIVLSVGGLLAGEDTEEK